MKVTRGRKDKKCERKKIKEEENLKKVKKEIWKTKMEEKRQE